MIDNIGYIASYSGGTSLFIGNTASFSSACRMGFVGEMPIMLSTRKGGDGFEPYEEFLERQAKMKGDEK